MVMAMTQLRSPRLAGQFARHVKTARAFTTSAALRKEIQDAYILSAARTPTAKVRQMLLETAFTEAPKLTRSVQWLLQHCRRL